MTDIIRASGGAAAAGGFSFQANIGAIAGVYTLRGIPVRWTDGLSAMAPIDVLFETSGPGDDLSLILEDGNTVEIQVKKGLRADKRFWSALYSLCEGIKHNRCGYGILIVCPNSSRSVREDYALALERIGEGREDSASSQQETLTSRLKERGYNANAICHRIRIRTVSALEGAGDAIAATLAELKHVCADSRQVNLAWQVLCQDSLLAIAKKSRRTVQSLSRCLSSAGIAIGTVDKVSPVAISESLVQWTLARTKEFSVLGVPASIPTDEAWIPLTAVVRDPPILQAQTVEKALADYREFGKKSHISESMVDANTIGTFRKLCVVVGGPGSGKTLLLKVLAREFAKDSFVSVRVRLRDLASRIKNSGCGVEEGLIELGIDGTGVSRDHLQSSLLPELVLLCDGLDECGESQLDIAAGLKNLSVSHPNYRIIVTTRPIGYVTNELRDWRHYALSPLREEDTAKHLSTLSRCVLKGNHVDGADELRPRIQAYLNEGSSPKILAKSPLLLGFGTALFLNWENSSKTKLELYQRIFDFVDKSLMGHQLGFEPPSKATRNGILHELGWLIAVSPLQNADELETQCAMTLEKTLQLTHQQSLTLVEQSFRYWETKGLIERLHYPGIELIAFIHKSCGEFAAALHLSKMDEHEAHQELQKVISNPDWDEILDFVSGTRLATDLAKLLINEFESEDYDLTEISRLVSVLFRPEVALSLSERKSFLKRVLAIFQSDDRQKAYRVGFCVTEQDLNRMPEFEQIGSTLIEEPKEWSRLVGWTILACHFPDHMHSNDLQKALTHYIDRSSSDDFFVHLDSALPFGRLPDRGIFENFLIGALKVLLPDQDAEYQRWLINEVENSQSNATLGFCSRFEALLREIGQEGASNLTLSRSMELMSQAQSLVPHEWLEASQKLLTEIVPSAFLDDDSSPVPATGLKYLAAFIEMSGINGVHANDVYVWLSKGNRLDDVQTLLRAAAVVFELPMDRLAAEARQMIKYRESISEDGQTKNLRHLLPSVDVAEVDWDSASNVDVNMPLVESLVHHSSEWIQRLAVLFIDQRLQGTNLRDACERLLTKGTGDSLFWAGQLTLRLPEFRELLFHRLCGPNAVGLHHLFDILNERDCKVFSSDLPILEKGLFNRCVRTAVSAAQWVQTSVSSEDSWLVELLRSASSYWLDNEDPHPQNRSILADSPREALLHSLCRIVRPEFEELVNLTNDNRRVVSKAAIEEIIGLARDSTEEKSRVVESIATKRFSIRQSEQLLSSDIPFQNSDLLDLCCLCDDTDSSFRLFTVRCVLTHQAIDVEKAIALA